MYGIRVFSYNTGAIKEMVSKKELGFVSSQGDWRSLLENITKKNKDNPKNIRKQFKERFHISNSVRKIKKILE